MGLKSAVLSRYDCYRDELMAEIPTISLMVWVLAVPGTGTIVEVSGSQSTSTTTTTLEYQYFHTIIRPHNARPEKDTMEYSSRSRSYSDGLDTAATQ